MLTCLRRGCDNTCISDSCDVATPCCASLRYAEHWKERIVASAQDVGQCHCLFTCRLSVFLCLGHCGVIHTCGEKHGASHSSPQVRRGRSVGKVCGQSFERQRRRHQCTQLARHSACTYRAAQCVTLEGRKKGRKEGRPKEGRKMRRDNIEASSHTAGFSQIINHLHHPWSDQEIAIVSSEATQLGNTKERASNRATAPFR